MKFKDGDIIVNNKYRMKVLGSLTAWSSSYTLKVLNRPGKRRKYTQGSIVVWGIKYVDRYFKLESEQLKTEFQKQLEEIIRE